MFSIKNSKEQANLNYGPLRLMERGVIHLGPDLPAVEIRRGMPILSRESQEIGKVAALVFDGAGSQASFILLGRLPEINEYRQVFPALIDKVESGQVKLLLSADQVENLPIWHSN